MTLEIVEKRVYNTHLNMNYFTVTNQVVQNNHLRKSSSK